MPSTPSPRSSRLAPAFLRITCLPATGNWEPATGNCEPSPGNCEPAPGNWEPAPGNWEPVTGNWEPATVNCSAASVSNGPSSHPNPQRIALSISAGEYAISSAILAEYSSVGPSVARRNAPTLSLPSYSLRMRAETGSIERAVSREGSFAGCFGLYSSVRGSSAQPPR